MELGADIFRTTGRAATPLSPSIVRELVPADAAKLQEEKGSTPSPLKRLSERHHALARNLAGGMSPSDAAIICGISTSRVSILQSDPAFKELLGFYKEGVDAVYRDMHEKLAGVASAALDEIQDRLEDAESSDKMTVGQLIEISKLGADRTGYGPQTSSTQVNINMELGTRLEAARKRIAERKALVIEG